MCKNKYLDPVGGGGGLQVQGNAHDGAAGQVRRRPAPEQGEQIGARAQGVVELEVPGERGGEDRDPLLAAQHVQDLLDEAVGQGAGLDDPGPPVGQDGPRVEDRVVVVDVEAVQGAAQRRDRAAGVHHQQVAGLAPAAHGGGVGRRDRPVEDDRPVDVGGQQPADSPSHIGSPQASGTLRSSSAIQAATAASEGDNLLLAKLCLDNVAKYRPPYLAYWSYARIPETVWKIEKLSDFWGIGRRTQTALEAMGIYTVRDLAHADLGKLKARFGVKGAELYYHANGLDASVIREAYSPQSQVYSASQILERNYLDYRQVALVVREMADNLASRLRREGRMTSCLGLGIGYGKDIVPKRSGGQMTFELTSSSKQLMA